MRKPPKRKTLRDLAHKHRPKNGWDWEWRYARDLEADYVKSLKNPKDVLDYLDKREGEEFLDSI